MPEGTIEEEEEETTFGDSANVSETHDDSSDGGGKSSTSRGSLVNEEGAIEDPDSGVILDTKETQIPSKERESVSSDGEE